MKKTILLIASALVLSLSANAEDYFAPGWYIGVKGGAQYTAGEGKFTNLISPNAAVNVGYQFTPVFGLRADINAWQGKGWMPIMEKGYKFGYAQGAIDATFNFIDMFSKTKRAHIVNPYIFVGFGGMYGFDNKESKALAKENPAGVPEEVTTSPYNWDKTFSALGRLGLGVDFKVGKRCAISLEVTDNAFSDKMNAKNGQFKPDFDYNISALLGVKVALGDQTKHAEKYASKKAAKKATKAGKSDAEVAAAAAAASAAAALAAPKRANFCNGKSVDEIAAEAAAAEAARIAAEKAAAEKAAAEAAARAAAEKAAREAAEKAAREKAAAEEAARRANDPDYAERCAIEEEAKDALDFQNIMFDLNKSRIRAAEQQKINSIIKTLKENPTAKVKVTGYADRATGKPKYNMDLSKKRAQVVTDAIKAEGIAADRIITKYKGDTVNPYPTPEENRVDVCIVK